MKEKILDKRLALGELLDAYGNLLTEKQRQALEMHLYEDLSYSEIAELLNISKQGVHDKINNAVKNLETFEKGVGFVAYIKNLESELEDILNSLKNVDEEKIIKRLSDLKNLRFGNKAI